MSATRIIAVANEKGGVGKTVTAVNLAAALNKKGQKVLVVDMDPQFNATRGLGVTLREDQPSVYDLIVKNGSIRIEDVIVSTAWKGLDLIPSHVDLSGAEVEMVNEPGRENRLREKLTSVPLHYDFILLDTPPSLSLLTINVFACAREVIVPCQTQPYAFSALEDLFDTIQAIQEGINPHLRITGIVATFFDARTRVANTVLDRLKNNERYRNVLFETVVRANTTIAESADAGKPVVFFRPSCYGALDYGALADELMDGSR